MGQLISIVIPTYNRANDLERALKSVLAQTYPYWEALVIDNCSSDNTDDVIKSLRDPRIKLFKINNGGIVAASRNLGIKNAVGDYIAFLDSDDWWLPQKLEKSLAYLREGADIVYHDLFLVFKSNQRCFYRKARTRDLTSPVFNDLIINGNALNNSSVVISRKVINEIDGFSERRDLVAIEDYDGWLRAAKVTERFKKVPYTLGYYWKGGGNLSNPLRTLKTIETFERDYAGEISRLDLQLHCNWLHYLKGRSNYCLGFYDAAKISLKLVLVRKASWMLKIKSLYMIIGGTMRMFFYALGIKLNNDD